MMPRILLLAALLSPVFLAHAETPEAVMERSRAMIEEGKQLRAQADDRFEARRAECYRTFLVNRCLDRARRDRLEIIQQARDLEIGGKRMELAERQRQVAERQAERERAGITPLVPGVPQREQQRPTRPAAEPTRDETGLPAVENRSLPESAPMQQRTAPPAASRRGAPEANALPEVIDLQPRTVEPLP